MSLKLEDVLSSGMQPSELKKKESSDVQWLQERHITEYLNSVLLSAAAVRGVWLRILKTKMM